MDLPSRAGLVTAWLNAIDDEGASRVVSALEHVVEGIDIAGAVVPVPEFVNHCTDVTARLYLPVAGETFGLPDIARDVSEAVHIWSPTRSLLVLPPGPGQRWWQAVPSHLGRVVDYGISRTDFRRTLRDSIDRLETLGLQRHDSTALARLRALEVSLHHQVLPRRLAGRPSELIDQASRVLLIVQIADESHGASVTSHEADARRVTLRDVARSARAVLMEAYSAADTVGP